MTSLSEQMLAVNQPHCWEFFSLIWLNAWCKDGETAVGSTKNNSAILWLPWTADFPRVGLWECELASSSISSIADNNTHPRGIKLVVTLVRPGCLAETGTVPVGGHVPMSTPCQAHCSPPSLSMDKLQSRDARELQCCVLHLLFVLMGSGNLSAASVSSSAKGADSLFH